MHVAEVEAPDEADGHANRGNQNTGHTILLLFSPGHYALALRVVWGVLSARLKTKSVKAKKTSVCWGKRGKIVLRGTLKDLKPEH